MQYDPWGYNPWPYSGPLSQALGAQVGEVQPGFASPGGIDLGQLLDAAAGSGSVWDRQGAVGRVLSAPIDAFDPWPGLGALTQKGLGAIGLGPEPKPPAPADPAELKKLQEEIARRSGAGGGNPLVQALLSGLGGAGGTREMQLPSSTPVDYLSGFPQSVPGVGFNAGPVRAAYAAARPEDLPAAPVYKAPDYTATADWLAKAAPQSQALSQHDRRGLILAQMLGGFAQGAQRGGRHALLNAIVGAGAGSASGIATADAEARRLSQADEQARRAYAAQMASFEQGKAGTEAEVANRNAQAAYQGALTHYNMLSQWKMKGLDTELAIAREQGDAARANAALAAQRQMALYRAGLEQQQQNGTQTMLHGDNVIVSSKNPDTGMIDRKVITLPSAMEYLRQAQTLKILMGGQLGGNAAGTARNSLLALQNSTFGPGALVAELATNAIARYGQTPLIGKLIGVPDIEKEVNDAMTKHFGNQPTASAAVTKETEAWRQAYMFQRVYAAMQGMIDPKTATALSAKNFKDLMDLLAPETPGQGAGAMDALGSFAP